MTATQSGVDGGEAIRQLSDAHRRLLTDNNIQFDLPGTNPSTRSVPAGYEPLPGYPPGDPSAVPQQQQQVPMDPSSAPAPGPAPDLPLPGGDSGMNGAMEIFLWVAAGIALVILLYWLFTFFRDRRHAEGKNRAKKERRGGRATDAWRPGEAQAVQLLDEADLLASQGRFDEAARLLLHRSIGEIGTHRPDLVRPALTSRDIAGHPLLPAGPAAAFARIAALVERSLFARGPLGADDWQDCRAAWHEFAFAEGWQR